MAADDRVLLAARNGFLVVLLALVIVSTYQFASFGGLRPEIAAVWLAGVAAYLASTWYYGRSATEN